jgi:DNA-binding NarL/FixJ family response regulator
MRLAVCAQQWLFASVLAAAFDGQGYDVLLTTDDPRELLDGAGRLDPDLCVVDARPGTAESLHDRCRRTAIVLLADAQEETAWDAYDAGIANGIVSKTCGLATVSAAVDKVARGHRVAEGRPAADRRTQHVVDPLTTRELEVLRLVVRGLSTEQIAAELGVSRHTVRTHIQQILRKLGVHGRGKIARAAATAGLVDVHELAEGANR